MGFEFGSKAKGLTSMAQVLAVVSGLLGAGAMYDQTAGMPGTADNVSNITEEEASGLLGDFQKAVSSLSTKVSTEVDVYRMESNKSSITGGEHSIENYGTLHAHIQNVGETEVNTTRFRMTVLTGQEMDGNCFTPENSTILGHGETYICDTGIVFPKVTNEVEVRVHLKGSAKDRTYSCLPEVTGDTVC